MKKKKYGYLTTTTNKENCTKTPVVAHECRDTIYKIFEKPKYEELNITQRAYIKLMCYIYLIGDYEISGFGRIQDGTITDFKILKQDVKSAYVECDENAVLDFIRTIPTEELAEWELDWHSHVNMGTSPSGTDTTNYAEMHKMRGGKQFPIMIINKKQDYTLANYISRDRIEDIELTIIEEDVSKEEIDEIYEEAKRDVETYCTKNIVVYTSNFKTNTYTTNYKNNNWQSRVYGTSSYMNYGCGYNDFYVCQCCGTELISAHEMSVGLCEDCEAATVKKGE